MSGKEPNLTFVLCLSGGEINASSPAEPVIKKRQSSELMNPTNLFMSILDSRTDIEATSYTPYKLQLYGYAAITQRGLRS